jgi:hypothetical protein
MADTFDAHAKAIEIENIAKDVLDSQNDRATPIESSITFTESSQRLNQEFDQLKQHPDQLTAVGKELEKISQLWIGNLPNAHISAENGKMTSVEFSPCMLCEVVGNNFGSYKVNLAEPAKPSGG